jgi:chromosomal replication initiation ATPase DnaA
MNLRQPEIDTRGFTTAVHSAWIVQQREYASRQGADTARDISRKRESPIPSRAADIIGRVAAETGVWAENILSHSRDHPTSIARDRCWAEMRKMKWAAPWSRGVPPYPTIARWFGVHHTSVLAGVRRHEARIADA